MKKNISTLKAYFVWEATGLYSNFLLLALLKVKANIWVENPVQIKRSLGLQRGKNDQVDALRIAQYAYRFQDQVNLYEADPECLEKLRYLYQLREQIVESRKQLKTSQQENQAFLAAELAQLTQKYSKPILEKLEEQIQAIEQEMQETLAEDSTLKKKYEQLLSIPGVGNVTAFSVLIVTKGFSKFQNAKQFACFCGIAPFENSSGKFKGKAKVSRMGNKKMKALLHMCALGAIRTKGEIKDYYERKVKEKRSKMSVLNAVRNKIIHRMFACIKHDQFYQKNYHFNLQKS